MTFPDRVTADHAGRRFEVEPARGSGGSGCYLLIFEGGRNTHDYLQANATRCREQAAQAFGVPADAWRPNPRPPRPAFRGLLGLPPDPPPPGRRPASPV